MAGSGVLLTVMDHVTDADKSLVTKGAFSCPVALIDTATFRMLSQMGGLVVGKELALPAARIDPAITRAHARHTEALNAIKERGTSGLSILGDAMCLAVAARVRTKPPAPEHAAAWLFGTLLPAEKIAASEAHAILRVQALGQAPELPPALIEAAVADAEKLLATIG